MINLLIFLLFVLAAVYGLFFLFFKVIWLLFKKHKNKWPLILAGVSTVLSGALLAMLIWWGISLIISPFLPMRQRIADNPQPIYGVHTYTDPQYAFTLQMPDGMDYSEWISFEGVAFKLGINTNLFKKDEAGKEITGPVVLSALIRQTQNIDEKQPFAILEQELAQAAQNRRLDIQTASALTIDGHPAYYLSGIAYTDKGPLPVWMQALYQNGAIIYAMSLEISDKKITQSDAQALVSSLRPLIPAPTSAN